MTRVVQLLEAGDRIVQNGRTVEVRSVEHHENLGIYVVIAGDGAQFLERDDELELAVIHSPRQGRA